MTKSFNSRNQKKCIVSVFMAAFNHEKYIRRAIESVLMQKTTFEFEIIVHDDASTDKTVQIIKEFALQYPDKIITVFQDANQHTLGKNILFDFVFPLVSGKYIANCECDDYWIDENKLQTQVDFLENNPEFTAVAHNCLFVDSEGREIRTRYSRIYGPFKQHTHSLSFYYKYPHYYPGQSATIVYRYDIFKKTDSRILDAYKAVRSNGDTKRNLMLLLNGNIFCFDGVMSAYRVVSKSGYSWTAKNAGKNLSGVQFVAHRDLNRFASLHYKVDIRNYYTLFRTGLASVLKYYLNPTDDNLRAYKCATNEAESIVHFYVMIAKYGILAIPTISRKVLRLDKHLLLTTKLKEE